MKNIISLLKWCDEHYKVILYSLAAIIIVWMLISAPKPLPKGVVWEQHTVSAGETVRSIATDSADSAHISRKLVEWHIINRNDFADPDHIEAGEVILVPVREDE